MINIQSLKNKNNPKKSVKRKKGETKKSITKKQRQEKKIVINTSSFK